MAQKEDPTLVAFDIHVVGDETGETWTGRFKIKTVMSKLDECRQDNFYRFYIGENNPQFVSPQVLNIAQILSQLRVRTVESPKWWEESALGENLLDDNLLQAVYDGMTKAVKARRDSREKAAKAAQDGLRDLGTLGDGAEDKAPQG